MYYLAQRNHTINAVIVVVAIQGLCGKGNEFQNL